MRANRKNNLGVLLEEVVSEYSSEVAETLKKEAKATARKTVKTLKQTSPKKSGVYAKEWKQKVTQEGIGSITVTVYNEDKPSLIHLLENGHAKRGGGRTKPIEHVDPAADEAAEIFIKSLEAKL